jgi:hypothetical protein
MDFTLINILSFIILTVLYFILKSYSSVLTFITVVDASGNTIPNTPKIPPSVSWLYLSLYFIGNIIIQTYLNVASMATTCGGGSEVFFTAFYLTFYPWFFIFGILIGVLIIVTGFKCAFSDVIGYFFVAGETHALFKEMLINVDVEDEVNKLSEISNETKADVVKTIVDIFGNSSILINTIVPENFVDKWEMLTPIMKPNIAKSQDFQKKLWNLVYKRDSVGEAMWYIYTGVLLCCIIQFNIATVGCSNSPQAQTANYNEFLQKEKIIEAQRAKANTVHTMG